jgi:hypothetical protein
MPGDRFLILAVFLVSSAIILHPPYIPHPLSLTRGVGMVGGVTNMHGQPPHGYGQKSSRISYFNVLIVLPIGIFFVSLQNKKRNKNIPYNYETSY